MKTVAAAKGWTADRIAALCGGRVARGGSAAGRIWTDSRTLQPGDCFVALRGEHFDGHQFVADAFQRGAAGAIVARADGVEVPGGAFLVTVPDPGHALLLLAAEHRRRHAAVRVLAITGSCGKTTTKDICAHVIGGAMPTVSSARSFNNDVGVPLTLFQIDVRTRAAVVEIGANQPGEIERLAAVAGPDLAIVTCVAPSHLQGLGSLDGVAAEKGRLVRALPPHGLAILNADDERVRAMAGLTPARKVMVSVGAEADWFATSVRCASDQVTFLLQGKRPVTLPRVGAHNVYNALFAFAAAAALGVRPTQILSLLRTLPPSPHRLERHVAGAVTVIDDTYNMNPASASAALRVLDDLPAGGRRIAVFGEMYELGAQSRPLHEQLGREAAGGRLDQLMVVGEGAQPIASGALAGGMTREQVVVAADADEALAQLMRVLAPGDVVLCKASRRVGLDRLVGLLRDGLEPKAPER
jgi:UDP-N-acetylmuramoyl-tripeptide--D-alanyl-D-alanine ligase